MNVGLVSFINFISTEHLSRVIRKPVLGVSDIRFSTSPAVQAQKLARGLKILCLGSRGIVPYSENKSADQLHSYHAAHLYLCFHIWQNQVFS